MKALRPSKWKIDYEAFNMQRIIENAAMAKLRTLKLYILVKGNLGLAYEYDVIIPKPHWSKEVEGLIKEEGEVLSKEQHEEESI